MAKTKINMSLDTDLVKKLREYSSKSMIPYSRIVEKAIKEYLKLTKSPSS